MATFILVHGASLGGWIWKTVSATLSAAGHLVYRPSLTGQGDRAHLKDSASLDTHIRDISNLILAEELDDVILVGHSYGGMVVTGVADCIPECVRILAYIDGLVPTDGQSATDVRQQYVPSMEVLANPYAVLPEQQKWFDGKLVDLPLNCRSDPIRLTGRHATVPAVFIRASRHPSIAMDAILDRSRKAGWQTLEIDGLHCPMVDAPDAVARVLLELA